MRINLVAALKETDPEVLIAYNNWIDALLEAKKPITRQALDIYQNNLNNYTDNKQAKIKILEIATMRPRLRLIRISILLPIPLVLFHSIRVLS